MDTRKTIDGLAERVNDLEQQIKRIKIPEKRRFSWSHVIATFLISIVAANIFFIILVNFVIN